MEKLIVLEHWTKYGTFPHRLRVTSMGHIVMEVLVWTKWVPCLDEHFPLTVFT